MNRTYLIAGIAAVAMAGTASAQSSSTSASASNGGQSTSMPMKGGMNMRQQIQSSLSQDGYSNVTVMPSSFYVHATDKKGQPVAMVITPDSVTEVTEIGQGGGSQPNGSSGMSKSNSSNQQ